MRGKKTEPETVYKIMLSYAVTGNYRETARNLGLTDATVRNIVRMNKDNPDFQKVCAQKKDDFVEKAGRIIDKGLQIIEKKMDAALIDDISLAQQSLKEIVTAVGTIYDKRALALGENTQNLSISFTIPKELNEYAE